MRQTRIIMGMPISVEIVDRNTKPTEFQQVFKFFRWVDKRFSPFKKDSETTLIDQNKKTPDQYSPEMKSIIKLAEQTKKETKGYFDVWNKGRFDPSGIVKGWAIQQAFDLLKSKEFKNFYIDAGGDIAISGMNKKNQKWKVGIRNPFNSNEVVKVIYISDGGVATSGTSVKGTHIYNPIQNKKATAIAQITVIGPDVYEADRMATAAFAMGEQGIYFIESLPGFEGYMIDLKGIATQTTHFSVYAED